MSNIHDGPCQVEALCDTSAQWLRPPQADCLDVLCGGEITISFIQQCTDSFSKTYKSRRHITQHELYNDAKQNAHNNAAPHEFMSLNINTHRILWKTHVTLNVSLCWRCLTFGFKPRISSLFNMLLLSCCLALVETNQHMFNCQLVNESIVAFL